MTSLPTVEPSAGALFEVGSLRKLHPCHLKQLEVRGITEETAKDAGLYSEHDRKKLADLVGWKSWSAKYGAALVFPYHDAAGQVVFSRVKPENPPQRGGKPLKYLQPKGVGIRAYFPPTVREKINRGDTRILITEGEFKSLCATQHGFPTIGLAGVSMWCRRSSTTLNADLAAIDWKGRKVYIAFDSDAVDNSNVALEEQKLAMALEREGAIVNVIRLPAGAPDVAGEPKKLGLDDYLVEYSAGDLERLIEQAVPAEKPDPGSMKAPAKEADPADEAKAFAAEVAVEGQSRIRYFQGSWWYWDRGAYRELPDTDLRAKAVERLADRYNMVKVEHATNLLEHLRSQTLVPSHLDLPCWLTPKGDNDPPASECVSLRNGVLHLPSYAAGNLKLIEPTPRFFTTCSVDFSLSGQPPQPTRWLAFLDDIFGDDQQSWQLLQDWFGYCLTPDTCQQKALFIVGPKRSGKGTIARVLTALLGQGNVAAPTLAGLGERFGLQSLIGKPLAIIHDARLSGRSDQAPIVERLLSITGEDHQTIDRKHRDLMTVKLPTRFMIMSNELPRLSDSSGALVGRLMLLETPNSFYGKEDHSLTGDLLAELPGIFAWAVEGWSRLQKRKRFTQPDAALERLQDLADLSSPVGEFLRERCDIDPEGSAKTTQVYVAWQLWCAAKGMRATGDNVFGRDLLAAASDVHRVRHRDGGGRCYFYDGLQLLNGEEWS